MFNELSITSGNFHKRIALVRSHLVHSLKIFRLAFIAFSSITLVSPLVYGLSTAKRTSVFIFI